VIFCLDTNVIIHAMRGMSSVIGKLEQQEVQSIKIPEIVRAELVFGCLKSGFRERESARVAAVLAPFESVPFAGTAVDHYAEIRCDLEARGQLIGPNDMLIAATALSLGATLVTANRNEFERVSGLAVEDWSLV